MSKSPLTATQKQTIPLSTVPRGQRAQLVRIEAGRRLSRRLTELGLTPGVAIKVLHVNGGPILLAVRGARLAIGRGMADKILVRVIEAGHV